MQQLPERIDRASLGRIRIRLRGVLRQAGADHQAVQRQADGNAGRYRPLSWRAEPQRNFGLRQAEIGETALSIAEIAHGRHIGEIQ